VARFFIPPTQIHDDHFRLDGAEAHHALHVLRKKVGDTIDLFDGRDRSFKAEIQSINENTIEGRILKTQTLEKEAVAIWLFAALIKGPRWDWLVQKACEVGVDVLIPVTTTRTVIHLEKKELSGKLERWNRIALEAAKQCGRATTMDVRSPQPFVSTFALSRHPNENVLLLFPWEKENQQTIRHACAGFRGQHVCLWIGPEGGWDEAEADLALKSGPKAVTLGGNLLRSETACIVAAALVAQELSFRSPSTEPKC